jgi:hypothetical protein
MSHLNRVEAYAKGRSNFSLKDIAIATQGSETGTAARLRDLRQMGYTVSVVKVKGTKARLYSVSNVRLSNPTSREVKADVPAKDVSLPALKAIAEKAIRDAGYTAAYGGFNTPRFAVEAIAKYLAA